MKTQELRQIIREEIRKVVNEEYNEFLDTDEGGWMREYIDKIAKNRKLDLDYRKEFDDAFELALTKLKEDYPKLKKKYPELELDFEYIVDSCKNYGINMQKLSLHLHVKNNRESEVEKIFHKALDRKIINFDVSALDSGGCSVTMDKNKLAPNMNYVQYYKFLTNYIIKNS